MGRNGISVRQAFVLNCYMVAMVEYPLRLIETSPVFFMTAIMGTLMDYAELAVQFGYITLFLAAFPLAPFLALVNNYVEFRSDAFKLLTQMQRPIPRGAEDIGGWQRVFKLITCIAVITNSALVRWGFVHVFYNQALAYAS